MTIPEGAKREDVIGKHNGEVAEIDDRWNEDMNFREFLLASL